MFLSHDIGDIIGKSIYEDIIEYNRHNTNKIYKEEEAERKEVIITHEDFKNLDPIEISCNDVKTMSEYTGTSLGQQDKFYKMTTHQEKSLWTERELQNFQIDVEKIDRLYCIKYPRDGQCLYLVCRMEYKRESSMSSIPIFVELFVTTKDIDYKDGIGLIFVSFDHRLFTTHFLLIHDIKSRIWQSAENDDYFNKYGLTRIKFIQNTFFWPIPESGMVTTHAQFKSVDYRLDCYDAKTIKMKIGMVLDYQTEFEKKTTHVEIGTHLYTRNQLESFRIDLEKIDRLYYIHHKAYPYSHRHIELVCRMKNDDEESSSSSSSSPPPSYIFVQMNVWTSCPLGFNYGYGKIFISTFANLFMNTIAAKDRYPNWNSIRRSMTEDGFDEEGILDNFPTMIRDTKNDYNAWFWGL